MGRHFVTHLRIRRFNAKTVLFDTRQPAPFYPRRVLHRHDCVPRRAINVALILRMRGEDPRRMNRLKPGSALAVLCVNQLVNRRGDARNERNEQQLFPRRVRECANINHAGARFDKGRALNERLTLLGNRYRISTKIKSQQETRAETCTRGGELRGTAFHWHAGRNLDRLWLACPNAGELAGVPFARLFRPDRGQSADAAETNDLCQKSESEIRGGGEVRQTISCQVGPKDRSRQKRAPADEDQHLGI
jgi:hypothetical protein